MLQKRMASARGIYDHGWLDTRHSFSFAEYYDPAHMGFRHLRVINEDRVAGGAGFPPHPHRDMEIISYIISGALEHQDSMGTGSIVQGGQVQRMTAGRGVLHSEFNASPQEPVHFLQIWIEPRQTGLEPGYEQMTLNFTEPGRQWVPIASGMGDTQAMQIHQNVEIAAARLAVGESCKRDLAPGRHAWIQVVAGDLSVNGLALSQGDGLAVSEEPLLVIRHESRENDAAGPAELILFDLA